MGAQFLTRKNNLNRTNNKYNARRTYSALCQREFASKAECLRGEDLRMLELAGEIERLEYQPAWVLSSKPKVTYTADFRYRCKNTEIVEDVKGIMTEATRVRIVWLRQLYGVEVVIFSTFRKGHLAKRPKLNIPIKRIVEAMRHEGNKAAAGRALGCSAAYIGKRLKEV